MTTTFTPRTTIFDAVVRLSEYFPTQGVKQQLTAKRRTDIEEKFAVNYDNIASQLIETEYSAKAAKLMSVLPDLWHNKYKAMVEGDTYIHQMNRDFSFMFDVQSQNPYQTDDDFIEDRVVVFFGLSKTSEVKRDASRMSGYLRNVFNWTDKDTDKGHFIGHSMGGGVDENLFAQKKQINRGQSVRGKVYRAMETYCATHQGTFCFSRPIYCDFSTRPFVLEYGLLKHDGTLWIEQFDNV